jgi:hypothetical protein
MVPVGEVGVGAHGEEIVAGGQRRHDEAGVEIGLPRGDGVFVVVFVDQDVVAAGAPPQRSDRIVVDAVLERVGPDLDVRRVAIQAERDLDDVGVVEDVAGKREVGGRDRHGARQQNGCGACARQLKQIHRGILEGW